MDLTEKHTRANTGVYEVMLTELVQKEKVLDDDFDGNLWIAVSSVDKYDFRNMRCQTQIQRIPAAENQDIVIFQLKKNMRTASQIL